MTGPGAQKVAEQIKFIAAEMLSRRIQDPRLGFVTITDVRLSKDWQAAEIFYTVLGDQSAHEDSALALEAAKGQVRSAVARGVKMKFTPSITFVADSLPESSDEFEALLDAVRKSDAEIAAKAVDAGFAGESDPYRHDDEDDGD